MKKPAHVPLAKRTLLIWGLAIFTAVAVVAAVNTWADHKQTKEQSTRPRISDGLPGQRAVCTANAKDICVMAPTVDFYPAGSESTPNPAYKRQPNEVWKSVGGTITAISGNTITLETTSKRHFIVHFPVDAITVWNQTISSNYGSYKIGVGDTLRVDYGESDNRSRTIIEASQIIHSTLAIDPTVPANQAIQRYPAQ